MNRVKELRYFLNSKKSATPIIWKYHWTMFIEMVLVPNLRSRLDSEVSFFHCVSVRDWRYDSHLKPWGRKVAYCKHFSQISPQPEIFRLQPWLVGTCLCRGWHGKPVSVWHSCPHAYTCKTVKLLNGWIWEKIYSVDCCIKGRNFRGRMSVHTSSIRFTLAYL